MEEERMKKKQLSKTISEKIETVTQLRNTLEKKKKTAGNSVDEQIVIAEMEYRLVKEEMALLTYQEKHWESAALWDVPPVPHTLKEETWDALHSYVVSLRERGAAPALHATQHPPLENSILVSCQGDGATIPKVEWAHQATELQNGDRLLEVNGQTVIGKDSGEVSQMLLSSRSVCRVVFLRPLSLHQTKETSNLRQELTTVVTRLNHKMMESTHLTKSNLELQKENDDLKTQSRKLRLQLVSLQSILLYTLQVMEKDSPSLSVFDLLKNAPSASDGIISLLPRLHKRSLQMSPEEENSIHPQS